MATLFGKPADQEDGGLVSRRTILCAVLNRSVVSDSLRPLWTWLTRHLCPWGFPGKNTGVGFYVLLQGVIPSQLKFRLLYTTRGGGVAGCCKLLGARILCFCSCSYRFGYNLAVNLQKNSCYLLFYNFLYEWKSVTPLKVRALRMGYHAYFRLKATF